MGKCMNVSLPRWSSLKLKGTLASWDIYDVLNVLLQVPLQTVFYLSTFLLTLQVMWMNIRPINPSQQRPKSKKTLPIKQRNMTLKELSRHNGVDTPNVYTAVNGTVFDVSSARCSSAFAGKDASRALATFSLETSAHNGNDDLSDLNPLQMDNLLEWEIQYLEKYPCVGRLVSSHQPNSLQTICVAEICAALKSGEKRQVGSLPLPKTMKYYILNYGRKAENSIQNYFHR